MWLGEEQVWENRRDKGTKSVEHAKKNLGWPLLLLGSICPVSLLNSIYRYFPGQRPPTGLCGVLGPAAGEGAVAHRAGVVQALERAGCECSLRNCTSVHMDVPGLLRELQPSWREGERSVSWVWQRLLPWDRYWRGQRVASWLPEGLKVSSSFWGGCGDTHMTSQQAGLRDVELWPPHIHWDLTDPNASDTHHPDPWSPIIIPLILTEPWCLIGFQSWCESPRELPSFQVPISSSF